MPNTDNKKQRSSRRRRGYKSKSMMLCAPFPTYITKKVRYVGTINLAEGAAGAGASYAFTPSSLFDPDNSGVGHQPMYFDQLCTSTGPYTRYRALRTTVKISFANTASVPSIVGWYASPNGTSPSSYIQAAEKPLGESSWVGALSGGTTVKTWIVKLDHAAVMGITKTHLLNDDYYAGTYNSSPTNNVFLIMYTYGIGGNLSTTYFTVELETEAQFFGLTNTGTS